MDSIVRSGGYTVSTDEAGEFALVHGRMVQLKAITVQDARDPPGHVAMEEEVFATWAATSLILAVMGTQFTSRSSVPSRVRIPMDVLTMTVAAFVLLWAALGYFQLINLRTRKSVLVIVILSIFFLYAIVVFLVINNRI